MRDGRTHPEWRRDLWAAAFLLLLLMWALGSCVAQSTAAPGLSGAQAAQTLTPTLTAAPARQAPFAPDASATTPADRATVTPVRTPKHKASVAGTRAPAETQTVALSGLPTIRVDRLPVQARDTLDLIQHGGPFPHRQDGAVFQNRERLLPGKPNGYYREYTVETPGSADRGARRIIAGDKGELFYTDDHYGSFRQVVMP
jgi:ribonuclease T1